MHTIVKPSAHEHNYSIVGVKSGVLIHCASNCLYLQVFVHPNLNTETISVKYAM